MTLLQNHRYNYKWKVMNNKIYHNKDGSLRLNRVIDELTFSASNSDVAPESPIFVPRRLWFIFIHCYQP